MKNFKYTDNATGRQTEAALYLASEFVSTSAPNSPVLTGSDGKLSATLLPTSSVTDEAKAVVVNRIAHGEILKGEVVRPFSGNSVTLSDPTDTLIKADSIGVAMNDVADGGDVKILILGILSDPSFSVFAINSILFLDDDGGITDVKPVNPTKKFQVIVGKYLGANEILINIQTPLALGA